jgi:hypothetical protein
MNKKPKYFQMILVLTFLGLFSSLILVGAHELTLPILQKRQDEEIKSLLEKINFQYDSEKTNSFLQEIESTEEKIYFGKTKEEKDGVVIIRDGKTSYGLSFTCYCVFLWSEEILSYFELSNSNVTTHGYNAQFEANDLGLSGLSFEEMPNQFHPVSGATSTSNSIYQVVYSSFELFKNLKRRSNEKTI